MLQARVSTTSTEELPAEILQQLCPDGKMTPSACARIMQFHEKEQKVKEVCDLSRLKVRPDDGRIYLLVRRKMISSNDYPGLIDKLYEHFYGLQSSTLESFFEYWMKWRAESSSASAKTQKENRIIWNSFLKDTEIGKRQLKELKVQDYIDFFRSITKDRTVTRKRFNDMKSVLNGMMYLAVEKGVIAHNCLVDINYKQFSFKAVNHVVYPYTEAERARVIKYLEKEPEDVYTLAIMLDFHLVLRISELKGLKWSDIRGDHLLIQRFVNNDNKIIEDIKGHASEGIRSMPLTPKAKDILKKIKALDMDSEFVFFRNGKPLSSSSFNRRLKQYCEALDIEYRPSHKLRFSTASIMYKHGVEDTELQRLLGHTTLNMTRHYLRNITSEEATADKMAAILG